MDSTVYRHVKTIWDYMKLDQAVTQADCIVGFGCYNEEIALRAAELYHAGLAPRILFTGGLGRNTREMWTQSEAERFAAIAAGAGVPEADILLENKSTNTGENILFTKAKFEELGMDVKKLICIHKPFMERRLHAALGVYWPEVEVMMTSPRVTIEEYIRLSTAQGLEEKRVIEVLVGDFQRIEVYARLGYQLPQEIPDHVQQAFESLVALGYTRELVK